MSEKGKKISIGTKPTTRQTPVAADAWVETRETGQEEKRKNLSV